MVPAASEGHVAPTEQDDVGNLPAGVAPVEQGTCHVREGLRGPLVERPVNPQWARLAEGVGGGSVECKPAAMSEQWLADRLRALDPVGRDVVLWVANRWHCQPQVWAQRRAYGRLLLHDARIAVVRGTADGPRVMHDWSTDANALAAALCGDAVADAAPRPDALLGKARDAGPLTLFVLGPSPPEMPLAALRHVARRELHALQWMGDWQDDEYWDKLRAGVSGPPPGERRVELGGWLGLLPYAQLRRVSAAELPGELAESVRPELDHRLQARPVDAVWLLESQLVQQWLRPGLVPLRQALAGQREQSWRVATWLPGAGTRTAPFIAGAAPLHDALARSLRAAGADARADALLDALSAAASRPVREGAQRRLVIVSSRDGDDLPGDWPDWALDPELDLRVLQVRRE